MLGSATRGAAVGVWAGVLSTVVLVIAPRAAEGDFYEIGNPLVYFGSLLLVTCVFGGTLVGAAASAAQARADGSGLRARPRSHNRTTAMIALSGLLAVAAIAWWGTR